MASAARFSKSGRKVQPQLYHLLVCLTLAVAPVVGHPPSNVQDAVPNKTLLSDVRGRSVFPSKQISDITLSESTTLPQSSSSQRARSQDSFAPQNSSSRITRSDAGRVLLQTTESGATYILRSDEGCLPCSEHRNCTTNVVKAVKGYWHRTPCSTHIQRCLLPEACDFADREQRLTDATTDVRNCSFDDNFLSTYSDLQCKEGYDGPLCGACRANYSRARSYACKECFVGSASAAVVGLSGIVILVLTGCVVRSNLTAANRGFSLSSRHLPYPAPSTSGAPSSLQMTTILRDDNCPSGSIIFDQSRLLCLRETAKEAELTKWKAFEIFRIAVNFSQVTAIAMAINVKWMKAVLRLFTIVEFMSGVTSSVVSRSVECLVSGETSVDRAVVTTLAEILIPVGVMFLFAVFWCIRIAARRRGWKRLSKRVGLSCVAVLYICYISLTKAVVYSLSCIEVHDSISIDVDNISHYWARDTTVRCYRGSHLLLSGLLGWPLLITLSLGFPVAMTYIILKHVTKDYKEGWLYVLGGFLFRAYRRRYVYWESTILFRKAALAVIAVFANSLGGTLQGALAVMIMSAALYFHTLCRPFRAEFDDLNEIESASLLASLMTFASSLFFVEDETSYGVRILFAVLIYFVNISMLCFFLGFFLILAADYLRTVLDREAVDHAPHAGTLRVIGTFLAVCVFGNLRDMFFGFFKRKQESPSLIR